MLAIKQVFHPLHKLSIYIAWPWQHKILL